MNYCYYESELGKNNAAKQQLVESENDDWLMQQGSKVWGDGDDLKRLL